MEGNGFPATADDQRARYLQELFDAPVNEHRIPTMTGLGSIFRSFLPMHRLFNIFAMPDVQ